MATIFSHPAVPLALGWGLGQNAIPRGLLWTGVIISILPDLDVLAFRLGVPYANAFGHRGFSHSLLFALLVSLTGALACRLFRTTFCRAWLFLFVIAASHGLLDALTNGGLGIAFLWPWSDQRYFAPFPVIEVAPLHPRQMFSRRGATVLLSELLWIWLPAAGLAVLLAAVRSRRGRQCRQSRIHF